MGADEIQVVKAVYEDGEVIFAGPVDIEGCWRVEVRFLEREDTDVSFETDPHRPEMGAVPDRLEELHRKMESNTTRDLY